MKITYLRRIGYFHSVFRRGKNPPVLPGGRKKGRAAMITASFIRAGKVKVGASSFYWVCKPPFEPALLTKRFAEI